MCPCDHSASEWRLRPVARVSRTPNQADRFGHERRFVSRLSYTDALSDRSLGSIPNADFTASQELTIAVATLVHSQIDSQAIAARVAGADAGAVLTFSGDVRNHHMGREVTAIDYHAYEAMALKEIHRIEEQARSEWPNCRIEIVHRLGFLEPGETSVFIAVASPHRKEGFAALRFAIDQLKETVPIWKKEIYPDGYAWIEGS